MHRFGCEYPADCFCTYRGKTQWNKNTFAFNETIIRYIEVAVAEKMERDHCDYEQANQEANALHGHVTNSSI